ncbi:hypothetical protein [Natronobacterium texcoconense]|nr:hypothetical protein [Natronobacterium texcoconense]
MNRRTVLQSAGVVGMAGLAGCLDGIQEHFGLQGVVPIEIENQADETYNLLLEAHDPETGRQTYDESFAVSPQGRTMPQHLDRADQRFRVVRFTVDNEPLETREVSITSETELVIIHITGDDLVIDVRRGDAAGNETVTEDDTPGDDAAGNETENDDADTS